MKIERYFSKRAKTYRWRFDITITSARIRRGEFQTRREAEEAVAALKLLARNQRYGLTSSKSDVTLGDLLEERKARTEKPIVVQGVYILQQWLGLIDSRKRLVDLKRADYTPLIDHFKARKVSPASINTYLMALSAALNDAPEYFPDLEEWTPPKLPWQQKAKLRRERILSSEELSALLRALSAERGRGEHDRLRIWRHELFDIARLMLLLGARRKEIGSLTDRQINLDRKTLLIDATKTGEERTIPLSSAAIKILKTRMGRERLFKPYQENHYLNAIRRTCNRAALKYGDKTPGGFVFHDLRHTAATVIEDAGIPYSAIAELLGHKRQDQTATYTHAQMPTLRRAVELLEIWCREIDGFDGNSSGLQGTPQKLSLVSGF